MSFTAFLKQVGKVLFGFGGGIISIMAGSFAASTGAIIAAILLMVVGFVMLLYGFYNRREL